VCIQSAINKLIKCQLRKQKYIQTEETLIVGEVQDLIAKREGRECNAGKGPARKVRGAVHCGCCGKKGHNSHTCKVEIEDTKSSDKSKK
jgi:hypothetical protein